MDAEEDDLISELSLDCQDADAVSADRILAEDELSGSVNFSQYTDNMHALGLQNVYSLASALPLDEEVALIRNYLSGILTKVAAWEEYAKKEMELTVEISCALQCGAIVKREDMMTHIRDYCSLRTVQCRQCHKIVVLSQVQYHDRTACVQRTVGCVNAFQGCGCLLTPSYMEQHLRFHCDFRLAMCRQYCGTQIPFKLLDMHEQFHCSQRQIECDQCKEPMLAHEYAKHLTDKCALRKVKCSVGCGLCFFAKDITHHEKNECNKYCSNTPCKMNIGPPSRLRYHEVHECPFRKVLCKHQCGEVTFQQDIDYHETYLCPAKPSYCTFGCGILLCRSTLKDHCDRKCPERLVRCPSNYVNRRIVLRDAGQCREGVVLRYRCVQVEQRNTYEVPCHELYVRFNNGHEWINLLTANVVLHKTNNDKKASIKTANNFQCGYIVFSDLTHHLQYECSHRTVIIETDQTTGIYGHSTKVVPFKNAVASSQSMVQLTEQTKNLSTGNGFVDCVHCGESLLAASMQDHILSVCPEVDVLCHIGCGKQIKRKLMTKHTADECPKRIVTCPQCGSNELWSEEIDQHMIKNCSHRLIPCALECGTINLLAHQELDHLNIHCPNRLIQCSCGLHIQQKELPSHSQFHCNVRPMLCPQGCGEIMPLNDRDNHINFFCKQRFLFRFAKTVECKNGCGAALQRRELLHHVTYECEKRLVECPQLCGSAVQLDRLKGKIMYSALYF
ncbi:hypothetical protein EON65_04750 [archaeon]|nr:MAG: hypothetical protein EON65_04750 [archaeon]